MSRSRWVVESAGYEFVVQWFDAESEDLGIIFGDGDYDLRQTPSQGEFRSYQEPDAKMRQWLDTHNLAVRRCRLQGLGALRDGGFFFETHADAKAAINILKSALKELQELKPWPDWALQAQAAGWKAPKGWRP